MTRLTQFDIAAIAPDWAAYERRLKNCLGVDLITLGALGAGRRPEKVRDGLRGLKLAVVPISSGGGVIAGFAESLAFIGGQMGLIAEVMTQPDQAGFDQAEAWGADLLIFADDDRFLAQRPKLGLIADNDEATGRGYAAALSLLNGGLEGRPVVCLGLGPVGRWGVRGLLDFGARPLIFDLDESSLKTAADQFASKQIRALNFDELAGAVAECGLILEATPSAQALPPEFWSPGLKVAAPGVPLAWPARWLDESGRRLWHDPLQTGTAVMLAALAV